MTGRSETRRASNRKRVGWCAARPRGLATKLRRGAGCLDLQCRVQATSVQTTRVQATRVQAKGAQATRVQVTRGLQRVGYPPRRSCAVSNGWQALSFAESFVWLWHGTWLAAPRCSVRPHQSLPAGGSAGLEHWQLYGKWAARVLVAKATRLRHSAVAAVPG